MSSFRFFLILPADRQNCGHNNVAVGTAQLGENESAVQSDFAQNKA